MIVRARVVVTMDGPPIENGAVRVRGERIIEVGKFPDLADTDEIADLGDHILLPGLINAHCHLDYTRLHGKISPSQSFADWIRAINAKKAKLSAEDYILDQPRFCRSETIWNNHHHESDRVPGIDRASPKPDSNLVVCRTD